MILRVTQKKCQAKKKHDVTESVNTFSCLEPAFIATFKTIEEAGEHMDTGHHIMTPEEETIYDNNLRRQWAVKQKAVVRISSDVKETFVKFIQQGSSGSSPKSYASRRGGANKVSEWVEVQTVRGYFSWLALQQKGRPVSEEEGEDKALEKEDYMEQLVRVAEQEIGLRHPLVYDDFNFCDLCTKGRLAKVLEKQNLRQLQSFCEYFDVEISGRANRKALYYKPLIQLANSCDFRK